MHTHMYTHNLQLLTLWDASPTQYLPRVYCTHRAHCTPRCTFSTCARCVRGATKGHTQTASVVEAEATEVEATEGEPGDNEPGLNVSPL